MGMLFIIYSNRDTPVTIIKTPTGATRFALDHINRWLFYVEKHSYYTLVNARNSLGTNMITVRNLNAQYLSQQIPPLPERAVMSATPSDFLDGFGQPLLFQFEPAVSGVNSNLQYRVWSEGRNQVNEWGKGDDL